MKVQSTPEAGEKREFISIGSAWLNESGNINVIADPEKNRKGNKNSGLGYRLYVVPVDESGEENFDDAIAISKFTVKEADTKGNSRAPSHSVFTWK